MSTSFKDKAGNEWSVGITVGALRRVLAQTGVDLTKLFEGDPEAEGGDVAAEVRRLLLNPITIADVLFAIVEPVAKERAISAEAFGELLEGESLADATDALMSALEVFFSAQVRDKGSTFGAMVRKFNEARGVVWQRAREMVEATDPTTTALNAFDKALEAQKGRVNSGG